jgi:hypothetical protein
MISAREPRPNSMMNIHHARNTIESEAIKLILLHIKPEVAQQKPQHLMRCIVKKPAVPEVMPTLATLVKVEMVRAIKLVQTIKYVFAGVRMDDIEEDSQTYAMCGVNQFLEFLGSSVSGTCGEEVGNLIPESCAIEIRVTSCHLIRE